MWDPPFIFGLLQRKGCAVPALTVVVPIAAYAAGDHPNTAVVNAEAVASFVLRNTALGRQIDASKTAPLAGGRVQILGVACFHRPDFSSGFRQIVCQKDGRTAAEAGMRNAGIVPAKERRLSRLQILYPLLHTGGSGGLQGVAFHVHSVPVAAPPGVGRSATFAGAFAPETAAADDIVGVQPA